MEAMEIIERLRSEWHAKTVYPNRQPNVNRYAFSHSYYSYYSLEPKEFADRALRRRRLAQG